MLSYENGLHIRHVESQLDAIHEELSRAGAREAGGSESLA